jgi:hypothetical protein
MLEIKFPPWKMRPVIFLAVKTVTPRLVLLTFVLFTAGRLAAAPAGPTLQLDYGHGAPQANPVSQFMYFVPLISPEPVSVFTNAGNTQRARVLSIRCRTNSTSFLATCEFEFTGEGSLQNVFDHSRLIEQRLNKLKASDSLTHQLGSINVEGSGNGSVEIEGTLTNGLRTVNEVRLRFNGCGHTSPVTINLQDICYRNDAVQFENEIVARVNTLAFRRQPGTPKMEVTLASIKRKDAGEGLWQNILGGLKGVTANLFLPPLTVEAEGHQAMLDFGLALATEKPAFTFPVAIRLKNSPTNAP